MTLRHARIMFDALLADFPSSCKTHLPRDACVVSNPNTENAIVMVLGGCESRLLPRERSALESLAKLSVRLAKEACTESHSGFIDLDLNWIPPTSNDVSDCSRRQVSSAAIAASRCTQKPWSYCCSSAKTSTYGTFPRSRQFWCLISALCRKKRRASEITSPDM